MWQARVSLLRLAVQPTPRLCLHIHQCSLSLCSPLQTSPTHHPTQHRHHNSSCATRRHPSSKPHWTTPWQRSPHAAPTWRALSCHGWWRARWWRTHRRPTPPTAQRRGAPCSFVLCAVCCETCIVLQGPTAQLVACAVVAHAPPPDAANRTARCVFPVFAACRLYLARTVAGLGGWGAHHQCPHIPLCLLPPCLLPPSLALQV